MGKISVLLPEREEARFCAYCRKKGHKKSTFIAHLIREHLDSESFGAEGQPPRRAARAHARRRISERKSRRGE